jgi:N-acetyl-gamma-glutamyl-phosphate reductase
MLNVGIIGASGYAGEELIDILLSHPQARINYLAAKIDMSQPITKIFPRFKERTALICNNEIDLKEVCTKCDLVFLALPHTVSMEFAPKLLAAGKKVIDLSADYRLKDVSVYEKFYGVKHKDKARIKEAIYGLPEIYRNRIKPAKLIANPGCYPTVSLLALAPLLAFNLIEPESIIIDAKSGTTGAGRKAALEFFFSEINEDLRAYKVNAHQHMPEINQELSFLAGKKIAVTFVPHLLPVNRGILATIYAKKSNKVPPKIGETSPAKLAGTKSQSHKLLDIYKKFYKDELFVRVKEEKEFPNLKDVRGTNFCDIGIHDDKDKIIVIACIDNLLKGASGQAVQNMNIMYNFPEYTALL